jgi:hypothetical protein
MRTVLYLVARGSILVFEIYACKLFASFLFFGGTLICAEKLANVRETTFRQGTWQLLRKSLVVEN